MKFIATQVDDSVEKMQSMAKQQQQQPGFAIDPYFYRSHVTYQTELKKIIYKSWLYAGHISQVKEQGDYFLFDLGEDSIIISRAESGEIHGSLNICRHRGARVAEEASGHRKTFVCPYHGWVYNTDGSLKAARHMEMKEGFDPDCYGLKQVQVCVFEGLIFINCDVNAASYKPILANIQTQLGAYDLPNAKIAHRHTYQVDANWKLVLENYLECYHCATSHRSYAKMHTLRELEATVEPINTAMLARAAEVTGVPGIEGEYWSIYKGAEEFGACLYTSRYALYDGYLTGSETGQAVAPLMGNIKGYDGGAGDFQLGPLTFMLNYPDHCVLYRFIPRGITQTDMEVVWFVNGDAEEGKDYNKEEVSWLWHHTSLEDEYIILRNNEGVNSHFFEPGPYHPEFEAICIEFVDWYLDALQP
ncbi:aromatic ring-hydroxylating oxygenase subunit alpha [Oceanicoccus sagamiensis]|uniref:Aromatic-ring-hydroxylating dioxygenase subunit alpha n=1 Tax=Oceanicoccus sagamiensis TaxID=716816 RepID=A0A1X9NHT2_9GAMM|nr:aromatic ring-hydroxylating dioxygenase subunit alpha [Oceanicoccus sagamiensis]ARN75952.1 aromatic-ring-hydroxylating dioxygenase subunit alpha [Oceanicoccus sagamiensis]